MSAILVIIFFLCSVLHARDLRSGAIRDAEEFPYSSDIILPVQNVKEVQSGYLTIKDSQLSSVEDAGDATSAPCVPRNSPEGIARLYIIAKQMAAEAEKGQVLAATDDGIVKVPAGGGELPPVVDDKTRPPFNDTTPYNGIDVSEVMELRIVKPLCNF